MALDMERRKWFPLRVKDKSSGSGRRRKVKKGDEKSGDTIDEKEDDDESTSSELEEEEAGEDENQNEGWSLDMLRTNMFAFIDGDGNIVYEKIEDDIANGMDSPKQEEIKEEEEEEEKEEEKEEEAKIGAVVGEIHLKPASKKPLKQMTASSVMVVNPETNVPEAVERAEPLPRINASILVHGHTMYIYGGILEVGDREISLDDMWTLDLRKREKWQCIWQGSMHKQVWRGAIYDDDDSYISTGREDGSDDDDDYSDENEDETMIGEMSTTKQSLKTTNRSGLRQEIAELNEKYGLEDLNRTPGSGETLADFYSRTAIYWNGHAAEVVVGTGGELSNKEVKREGFKLAKDRYEELKPVLDKLAEMEIGSSKSDRSSERSSKGEKKKEKSKKSSKR